MSITREDFRKMIARHDGGFTFQAEWLNMLRGKDVFIEIGFLML